jgi:hypothetical protein
MSRKITIYKFSGNTDYSVNVEDSYGKEHHLGYISDGAIDSLRFLNYPKNVTRKNLIEQAEEIWKSEVEPKKDLLGDAIAECVKMDEERGVEPSLD